MLQLLVKFLDELLFLRCLKRDVVFFILNPVTDISSVISL